MGELRYCPKCNKSLDSSNFYKRKSDGSYMDMCKKCITLHVNPFKPETFLHLLEDADVAYSPREWNAVRDRAYAKDPKKMGAVFGKYLSKMRLGQYSQYSYKDTDELIAKEEEERKKFLEEHPEAALQDAQLQQQYEAGLINEAEYKTRVSAEMQHDTLEIQAMRAMAGDNPYDTTTFGMPGDMGRPSVPPEIVAEFIDPSSKLTSEDKLFLATKWGVNYKPIEWIELEKFYSEMCESFDIRDADSVAVLKLICKTNLKMNQSLDIGDVDGFNKLSRSYEAMRKSAKFTKAQSKEDAAGEFDSVGQIVYFAESKKGGGKIKRYETTEEEQDIVDKTIVKLQDYYKNFINNDPTLRQQIESYLRRREGAAQMKEDNKDGDYQITDKDLTDFNQFLDKQREEDNNGS